MVVAQQEVQEIHLMWNKIILFFLLLTTNCLAMDTGVINDKGNLFVAGNVGINSLNPGQQLDVTGTIRSTNFIDTGVTASNLVKTTSGNQFTAAISGTDYAPATTGSNLLVGNLSGGFSNVTNSTALGSEVGINVNNNENIFDVGGNVGIGTIYAGHLPAPVNGMIVQGNVGIGSPIPGQALDVTGTVRSTNLIVSSINSGTECLQANSSGVVSGTGSACGSGGGSGISTITDGVNTVTGATNLTVTGGTVGGSTPNATLTISGSGSPGGSNTQVQYNSSGSFSGNSGFVYNGTNVGIGTSTASKLLTIGSTGQATIDSSGNLATSGTGSFVQTIQATGNFGQIDLGNTNTVIEASSSSPYSILFNTSNTYRGQVNSSGNFSFGGSSSDIPSSRISINGGETVGSGYYTNHASPSNGILSQGNVGIGTWTSLNGIDVTGGIATGSYAGVNSANAGSIITSGNVGIGSPTPGQLLDVSGTVRMLGFNLSTSPTNNYVLTSDASGNGTWQAASGGSSQWTTSSNNIYFNGNSSSPGNVGIDNTNPGNSLDVHGTVTAQALEVTPAGNVGIGTIGPIGAFEVGTGNTPNILTVGGNISIGTTIATQLLQVGTGTTGFQVSSSGNITSITNDTNSSLTNTLLKFDNTNGEIIDADNAASTGVLVVGSIHAGGILRLRSTSGIGIGADYTAFQVGNNGGIEVGRIQDEGGTSGNFGLGTTAPSNRLVVIGNVGIGTNATDAFIQNAAPNGGMIVESNVGIGSTNPGQFLDVQGTIRVSKLGGTIAIASGSNGCQGQSTLSSGTVTISTTCAPATSQGIFLQDATTGTLVNVGTPTVGTVTGGTSFVINSSNTLDTSNVNWWIIKSS